MSKVASLSSTASADVTSISSADIALLRSIVMVDPASIELEPEPLPQEWILSGTPVARSKNLARTSDWTSTVVVWDCTPGQFRWHYNQDEAIFIVSGECFLMLENGGERRFGPGDVGFFPAGTMCNWRISQHLRKVAVLKETMPRPLGLCLKVWKKLLRMVGLSGKSPL